MDPKKLASELLSLEGRAALVSGAGSGIGRGIALRLADMGASVALMDIDEGRAAEAAGAVASSGGRSLIIKGDVRSEADCRRAAAEAVREYGRVDILCNGAGVILRKDVVNLAERDWDFVLDVTLKGTYLLSRAVIPRMVERGGGCIVNIGSGWSLKAGPKAAAYCAAKAGVANLTRALAIDHGPQGIRVNCVCPGDVDTPMLRDECRQVEEDWERFLEEAGQRPLGRIGRPEDVANAVLFLVSPMSSWITGAVLVVDGGGLA